jgi:MGT family glycosyltransferase
MIPLVRWAKKYGEVTVVAPKVEQSGKSHGIDIIHPFEVKKFELEGVPAYAVDSTPADCIRFALLGLKLDVDLIISVGQQFNIGKLKNIPPNVYVYKSVPQLKVLKMADVFVTHGGMNSVSEALYHGVPMVVIPFGSDQPVNARCVEQLGVGMSLTYYDADKTSIKEQVMLVLSDSEMKANTGKVQELIKKAPGNAGAAEIIIQYFEKEVK